MGKKRKATETVDVDAPDESSPTKLLRKLQESINKLSSERDTFEKEAADLVDEKKILSGRAKHLEKEVAKLKKHVKDSEATAKLRQDETVKKAMKSASTAILEAKIVMAKEERAKGIGLLAKELKDWQEALSKLKGVNKEAEDADDGKAGADKEDAEGDEEIAEVGEKVITDSGEVGTSKQAETGDEGNIAQT